MKATKKTGGAKATKKAGSSKTLKGREDGWKLDKKDEKALDRAWESVAGGSKSKPAGKKRK